MPFNFKRMPKPLKVRKVLVLNFQTPAIPAEWRRVNAMVEEFTEAMIQASQKILVYQTIRILDVPLYPVLVDGRQYNDVTWKQALQNSQAALRDAHGNFLLADYQRIIDDYEVITAIQGNFSRMAGQKAFWCNAPGIEQNSRRFVMMGFNYERGVHEMVHSFAHRAESILAVQFGSQQFLQHLYNHQPAPTPKNEFEQWLLEHGTVHRTPGGVDYGQDEYAWLGAFKTKWWLPVIDPNMVKV
jgi:hypothetical protein